MISESVRAWVTDGSIKEETIQTWCVLNEPAGWQVGWITFELHKASELLNYSSLPLSTSP